MNLPRARRLGVDVGKARIGLAESDPDGLIATPVATVARVENDADILAIVAHATECGAGAVYVGLPRHLSGSEGAATEDARAFAARLRDALAADVAVQMVDERLTTVTATQALRASGRKAKSQRLVIDQQAAVIILQSALDFERQAGARAGEPVEPRQKETPSS